MSNTKRHASSINNQDNAESDNIGNGGKMATIRRSGITVDAAAAASSVVPPSSSRSIIFVSVVYIYYILL